MCPEQKIELRPEVLVEKAWLLIGRLERISADSVWAHRSSGVRGGLLRVVERYEAAEARSNSETVTPLDQKEFLMLIEMGFEMLEKAAREKTGAR